MYPLHTLGWGDFQSLCATILTEVLGQTFQRFAETSDAGRDGAFHGRWKRKRGEELRGTFVMQCKFTAREAGTLRPSDVADELAKANRLSAKGLAQNYLLLTNASLSARTAAELERLFLQIPGIRRFEAFGGEWITGTIRENQRLRTMVPRLYGLGDLTEILDERVYTQAQEILSWLGDELERFVVTESHHKSVKALTEKGFVLLLGDPGSGKSTIAAALALAAADTWRSRVVKVCSTRDFVEHWNPREPDQFFWVDDAFGQRQYERERALDWNHALPHLNAALKRGARAIFTSRSYIYRDAVEDLKESIFPLLKESRVVIEVEKLTTREREQILYNHLRLGNQPAAFRRKLKPFLSEVAAQNKFLPETARRLGDRMFTQKVAPTRAGVLDFVSRQEDYLRDVIVGLGDANRAALGMAFMRGGRVKAGLALAPDEERPFRLLNASIGQVRKSVNALEGSLLLREVDDGETFYRFKHPTIRDAYGAVIAEDANLMDVFLRGARAEVLVEEVTCGDVGLEGVKLIVPRDGYSLVLGRLQELKDDKPKQILTFLATRCDREFLELFLREEPSFLASLKFPYWLGWSQEAKLFSVLHGFGLLPETQRRRFAGHARSVLSRQPQWPFAYDQKFRALLRSTEIRALRAYVGRTLDSRTLRGETAAWERGWDPHGDRDPDDHFWAWRRQLEAFAWEFRSNRRLYRRFRAAKNKVDRLIARLEKARKATEGDLTAAAVEEPTSSRSIFEDVDE